MKAFAKVPRFMATLPLVLLLLSRGILANQAPLGVQSNKCFTGTVSGKASYDNCCSGAGTGIGKLDNAGDTSQAFHYTCASYMNNDYDQFPELVHSARACAEVCMADSSCQAGAWDSASSVCLTASTTNLEYTSDPDKTYLRFEKANESDLPPTESIECVDQVADAKLACESQQQKKCKTQMDNQAQDLRSQCDERVQDQCGKSVSEEDATEMCDEQKAILEENLQSECEVEKNSAARQWEKDQAAKDEKNRKARIDLEAKVKQLQKQEAEDRKNAEKDRKSLENLKQQNQQLQERLNKESLNQPPKKQPDAKQPSKPFDKDPVYDIPPLSKFKKCSDMQGQEYTVMGVTYTVFCGMHPQGNAESMDKWRAVDPSFLMGMCSTTPGCQGVKLKENFAQLSSEHEFPPTNRVNSKWWSLVPKEQRADNEVSDIRSQVMDDNNKVRCPEVDGKTITDGEKSYQLNCNKHFNVQKRRTVSGVKTFNECLVSCSVTKGCKGVMRDNYCSLVFSHKALPQKTPEGDQTKGDSWVAMLTEAQ